MKIRQSLYEKLASHVNNNEDYSYAVVAEKIISRYGEKVFEEVCDRIWDEKLEIVTKGFSRN